MAAPQTPTPLSVEQLLEAVDHLSPAQRREFERRLALRRGKTENEGGNEAALAQAARARLPVTVERRLKRLIAKSERGELSQDELAEYRALSREAQRVDAEAAEALSELVRRSGKTARAVRTKMGAEGGGDGA